MLYVLDDPKSLSSMLKGEYAYILLGGGKIVGAIADGQVFLAVQTAGLFGIENKGMG